MDSHMDAERILRENVRLTKFVEELFYLLEVKNENEALKEVQKLLEANHKLYKYKKDMLLKEQRSIFLSSDASQFLGLDDLRAQVEEMKKKLTKVTEEGIHSLPSSAILARHVRDT